MQHAASTPGGTSANLSSDRTPGGGEDKNWVGRWRKPQGARAGVAGFLLLAFIASAGAVVYLTGGTRFVWAHLMYLPVVLAATCFGIYGGIAAAVLAGLALGPYMPLDVASGQPQAPSNWICRMAFFLLVGILSGLISRFLNKQIDRLKEAKGQIQHILNNTKDVIFQIDLKGNYIYGNAAAEHLTGHPLPQLLRMNMMDLVTPEQRAHVEDRLQRRLAGLADEKSFEFEILHRDGHRIWVELTTSEVRDPEQRLTAIQGIARDITERKRAAETITLFRALVDHANDSIEVVDPETGRFLDVNEKFSRLHGYTREECLAITVFETDPQLALDDHKAWKANTEALQRFGFLVFESEHRRKDGSVFPVEVSASYIRLERDYILAVARDITDRKRVEAVAKREQLFTTAMIESMPGIIYLYNEEGKFLRWNRNFETVSGYSAKEIAEINPLDFFAPDEKPLVQQRITEVLVRGKSSVEASFVSKDGRATPYFLTGNRILFNGTVCVIGMGIDLTERRALETQLRQSQKMEAIGQLAGGVAHDFNNILAVIQMQADLLKAACAPATPPAEFADEIAAAAQRAAALTRRLLMFSRKETIHQQDLDLNQAINDMTKMLRRTLGADIQVQFKFALQPMLVHADAGMMDQVLMNLAVNARDAMSQGGKIIIETAAVDFDEMAAAQSPQARPGSFVSLSVSDTGCGIPPENLQRIFEPFFTTKEVGKGTGLGLATVFGIIQQHQGWINVYSEVNRGTTFRVYLPRLNRTSGKNAEEPAAKTLRGGNETILFVEDDPFLRAAIHKALLQFGYHVFEAANGPEAIETWRQQREKIHLLLTDMVMPGGITGIALGERLLNENPRLKVIYTSGYSAEIAARGFPLKEGINFLTKPFQAEKLAQIIRAQLDHQGSA